MSIAAANATIRPAVFGKAGLAKSANAIEHHLQSVFSAVLEQAGQQGYASAEPVAADLPLEPRFSQAGNLGSTQSQRLDIASSQAATAPAFERTNRPTIFVPTTPRYYLKLSRGWIRFT